MHVGTTHAVRSKSHRAEIRHTHPQIGMQRVVEGRFTTGQGTVLVACTHTSLTDACLRAAVGSTWTCDCDRVACVPCSLGGVTLREVRPFSGRDFFQGFIDACCDTDSEDSESDSRSCGSGSEGSTTEDDASSTDTRGPR
jgi:hypothetical protein